MPSLRRVIPALVGLLALSELGVGVAAAADQRADLAKQRRIATEKRVEKAYVDAVRPLVVRVFDAVQPVQDVADAFAKPQPGQLAARDDVILHGGAVKDLAAVSTALHRLTPPARFRDEADQLGAGLTALTDAMKTLDRATHAKGDRTGLVRAYGDGFDALLSAEQTWGLPVSLLYPDASLPLPWADRISDHGRHVPTQGGFIQAADLACAKTAEAIAQLPDRPAADEVLHVFPKQAALIRSAVRTLRRVPRPASAGATGHRLDVQLQAVQRGTATLDQLSAALRRHDLTAYKAALPGLTRFERAMDETGAIYTSLGATFCGDAFTDDTAAPSKSSPQRT